MNELNVCQNADYFTVTLVVAVRCEVKCGRETRRKVEEKKRIDVKMVNVIIACARALSMARRMFSV